MARTGWKTLHQICEWQRCLSQPQGGDPGDGFSRGELGDLCRKHGEILCFFLFFLGIGDFTVHIFFIFSHRNGMMIPNDSMFFQGGGSIIEMIIVKYMFPRGNFEVHIAGQVEELPIRRLRRLTK